LSLDLGVVRVRLQHGKASQHVGCGLATYFWSWPKNTKRKVTRQEEKGGSWNKGRGGEGRERKGPAEEAMTRLGPEGHRRKQQSEKQGR
jgi:hypothetical protein